MNDPQESSISPAVERPGLWRRLALALISAAALVVCLFTLAGFAARIHWRCEQLSHFRVQYFWLLLVGSLVMIGCGRRYRSLLFGTMAAINLATIAPIYLPASWIHPAVPARSTENSARLRLLTFNSLASNRHHQQVLQYILSQSPDIVIVQEVTPAWSEALDGLRPQFPYQHHVPRDDNFGIAILSQIPWQSVKVEPFPGAFVPSIVARFKQDDANWIVVGTHPVPPSSAWTSQSRNEQLAALAELVRQQSEPVILAGDLNVTSWSPYFTDLLREAGLCDSRQGFGVQFSWVSRLPLTHLPIDHVLVSPEIHVTARKVGPHLGSDHRPIVADLLLPKLKGSRPTPPQP